MPQDAFTLRLNALELNKTLQGAKINKIIQPAREEMCFLVYTGTRTTKLVLNANASDCGVYLTDGEKEPPAVAPNFCMLLRKHLQGAEIKEVFLVGFERILALRLACVADFSFAERILYCEIMGKYSNLVLTENGVILGAMKTSSVGENNKRLIFPGARYVLPAPQDKVDPTDYAALYGLLKEPPRGELARFLFENVRGIAPVTAEAIVNCYGGGIFAKHVYDYLFSDEISACVTDTDFLARYWNEGRLFPTLNEAQAYFYARRQGEKSLAALERKLLSAVHAATKKWEKRLAQTLEKQLACKDAELNRIKGELITANLWQIRQGISSCELVNYYDEEGKTLKIALDPRRTPSENAQDYFKRYRKQKRTLEMLAPMEAETREELAYLASLSDSIGYSKEKEALACIAEELTLAGLLKEQNTPSKRKKQEPIPFRSFEKEGFQILAGRSNLENDKLLRAAKPDDIWLHAQKYHSAHLVIRTEGREVSDEVLVYAASLCAAYSAGRGDKIPVDYCRVKNVKKPRGSKPGFVTYTDFKTIYTAPVTPQ